MILMKTSLGCFFIQNERSGKVVKAIGDIGKIVKAYIPEPYNGRFYVNYDICNNKLNVTKML
jgi:hypothetical protein